MKDNLIIYVSSHNNYDMLEGEVLKNIPFDGYEFINVDDGSVSKEITKGKSLSEKHNFVFLENKSTGVQMATQTIIDFVNENRPNCKWVFCFQHDNYPITENFFNRISKLINDGKVDKFSAMGFNAIDMGKYTFNSYHIWKSGEKPMGILGWNHLSELTPHNRWVDPRHNPMAVNNPQNWNKPFSIEIPVWMGMGINVKHWNDVIEPSDDYQFHIWFPDIIMQFNYHNIPCIVLPDLYTINRQELKKKYNIPESSASSNDYYHGTYKNHHNVWKERWGWDYENVSGTYPSVSSHYKGTLIDEYFNHDVVKYNKPLRTYDLGEY